MIAEADLVLIQQAPAMLGFLVAHPFENARRGRKVFAEAFGKLAIDAPILLLEAYRKGKDFAFTQVFEGKSHAE
jgi:hypothetical protein